MHNPHTWSDPLGLSPYENNGGLGQLVKVHKPDPAADALAERLGGESRVKFENDPKGREIDAISDEYVAQSKPGGMQMGSALRNQGKATFEYAIQSGRTPYFHFDGEPGPGVVNKLKEYGRRYGIEPVIDTTPLE
ncbi:restriction endonuclease fold toxin [Streptomyces albovinaceus]|uniref:restriction endonuclease fold toxin n=1 Tax=Streptomyces albovinaceus TaxID=66867 RepID=UPI003CC5E95C